MKAVSGWAEPARELLGSWPFRTGVPVRAGAGLGALDAADGAAAAEDCIRRNVSSGADQNGGDGYWDSLRYRRGGTSLGHVARTR